MRRRKTRKLPLSPRLKTTTAGALIVSAAVGLTALSASAGPQHDAITRAQQKAKAAATAQPLAHGVLASAKHFTPAPTPDLPTTPEQWQKLGLSLDKAKLVDGRYIVDLKNGARVTLTLDPELQQHLTKMFQRYKMPHGAVVLLEPSTGRVLAMVSHNSDSKKPVNHLARKPRAPSASVFKVITAAALIELNKIQPDTRVCYHGGRSRLTEKNIKGDKRLDTKCNDLSAAVAWSINSIIAKLAFQHLKKDDLKSIAEKFGYNSTIPFELPLQPSKAEFVDDPVERARSAAGFWHTYLTPLHGALIGATIANDGVMMRPTLIDRYAHPARKIDKPFKPQVLRRVIKKTTAQKLSEMMERTTRVGTARRYFRFRDDFPKSIHAAGKTGTLSEQKPSYLGFTWFVGFANDTKLKGKKVAVSALACNTPIWHIKGAWAASEAVRKFFEVQHERAEAQASKDSSRSRNSDKIASN